MVTAKIAVELRVFFLVARNAEMHLEVHSRQPVHDGHINVTPEAVDVIHYMWLMPELHIIRHEIGADPGDRNFAVQMLLLLHKLRMHRDYIFMAKEAFFDFGQPRMLRALHIRMTEPAVDLFNPGMYPVAEVYGLDRSYVLRREKIIEV
jgi:hypothetical protein